MTDTYIVSPAYSLGDPVPITPEGIAASEEETSALVDEGYSSFRHSESPQWTLAADATTPVLKRLADEGLQPSRYLYLTETSFEKRPSMVLAGYLQGIDEDEAPVLLLSGYSCANFVAGLDAGSMMLDHGDSTLVLVTSDVVATGRSRAFGDGLAIVSDAAAACSLTDRPVGRCFQVLSTALRSNSVVAAASKALFDLRASGRQIRAVSDSVLAEAGISRDDVRWVVVNNYRNTSRQFIAMASGFRDEARVVTTDMSMGHCHAADSLITLATLQEHGDLQDGDHVLVVATGGRAWSAAALRYTAPEPTAR